MKARELITKAKGDPLFWNGEPVPSPKGGDTCQMGALDMRPADKFEVPTHVEVYCTTWGDYGGDDVQRSNHRSLLRDHPDVFIDVVGGWSSHFLALPIDAELDEGLFAELVGIANEYPVYDEDDHSELVTELAQEAWEGYLSWDVMRQLREINGAKSLETTDEHKIRERFYEIAYEQDEPFYAESAVDVVFPNLDEMIKQIAGEIRANPDKFELA